MVGGLVSHLPGALVAAETARPNVILIVADDLGCADLGVTGSKFHQTPNLDRLAQRGVRFTQAYAAAPVCSPTRAALLTGKAPARLHLTDWIPGDQNPNAKLRRPDWTTNLPLAEVTLAETLRDAGYATAHIGKWHLGGAGFGPTNQGFSINLGGGERGQPPSYFSPYGLAELTDGPAGEYLTDREGGEAAKFITAHAQEPFFLNLWFHAVHTPLQAKPDLSGKYLHKAADVTGSQTNAIYATMLESLDAAVGRVLEAVDASGLRERTLIVFTSDNGGLVAGRNPPTSNAPLRAGKGTAYEGALRVPLLVAGPGVAAGQICAEPVISMDLRPTILAVVGATNAPPAADGVSLLPLLRDPAATLPARPLCWHYPHYHSAGATPFAAIRESDWKYIQFYDDGRLELYNLRDDPGEARNLIATEPARAEALARKLMQWQQATGAQWPMANPDHRPAPVAAAADGTVLLHARTAVVHGSNLRFEPQPFKNTLGYWSNASDWVDWQFTVNRPGRYTVELLQGCGSGHGGSEVAFTFGEQRLPVTIVDTGGFQNFTNRVIGEVTLGTNATHTLTVKPVRKPGGAVMDLRQVRLVPAGQ